MVSGPEIRIRIARPRKATLLAASVLVVVAVFEAEIRVLDLRADESLLDL